MLPAELKYSIERATMKLESPYPDMRLQSDYFASISFDARDLMQKACKNKDYGFIQQYEKDLLMSNLLYLREVSRLTEGRGKQSPIPEPIDEFIVDNKRRIQSALDFLRKMEADYEISPTATNSKGGTPVSTKLRHLEALVKSAKYFPAIAAFYDGFKDHPKMYMASELVKVTEEYSRWDRILAKAYPEASQKLLSGYGRIKEVVEFLMKEAITESIGVRQSWLAEFADQAEFSIVQNKDCSRIPTSMRSKDYPVSVRKVTEEQALPTILSLLDGLFSTSKLLGGVQLAVGSELYGESKAPSWDTRKPIDTRKSILSAESVERALHAALYLQEWEQYQTAILNKMRGQYSQSREMQSSRARWFELMNLFFARVILLLQNHTDLIRKQEADTISKKQSQNKMIQFGLTVGRDLLSVGEAFSKTMNDLSEYLTKRAFASTFNSLDL